ncbi:MAG: nicotinate-nicotinamide nucleotide adenylyltransferase [Candidatus Tectimicrobiota bacterium]
MEHPTAPGIPHIRLFRRAPQGLPAAGLRRLGVLGGAYNPITRAHLAIAETVREHFGIHEVLFVLPAVPPHKPIFGASLEQRLEMMCLAVADCPYASVGLSSHGLFLDMYQGLQTLYPPGIEVFFLTGRDAAERILTWPYEDAPAALQHMFTAFQLLVCDREGTFQLPDEPLLLPYRDRIHRCPMPAHFNQVSATEVRQRCQRGQALDDLIPPAVAQYIARHRLYHDDSPA